jgi:hypothetical protein
MKPKRQGEPLELGELASTARLVREAGREEAPVLDEHRIALILRTPQLDPSATRFWFEIIVVVLILLSLLMSMTMGTPSLSPSRDSSVAVAEPEAVEILELPKALYLAEREDAPSAVSNKEVQYEQKLEEYLEDDAISEEEQFQLSQLDYGVRPTADAKSKVTTNSLDSSKDWFHQQLEDMDAYNDKEQAFRVQTRLAGVQAEFERLHIK